MANEDNKILKYNRGEKSMKAPFIMYADIECQLKKSNHVKIILKNLTQKKKKQCICLMGIDCLHNVHLTQQPNGVALNKNKIDCYRGEDCME